MNATRATKREQMIRIIISDVFYFIRVVNIYWSHDFLVEVDASFLKCFLQSGQMIVRDLSVFAQLNAKLRLVDVV